MSMGQAESVRSKREKILEVAARHGAMNVRLFGSLARREERADSDVDLLVDMEEGRSLLDLSHLLQDMEELLGCKVHLVEPEAIHRVIRKRILEEAVPL
jgi:predicted nucleotidyltransferase